MNAPEFFANPFAELTHIYVLVYFAEIAVSLS
jgi:hypothetical protein